MVAPLRPLLHVTQGVTKGRGAITRAYQMMGGAPRPLVRWAVPAVVGVVLVFGALDKAQDGGWLVAPDALTGLLGANP